MTKKNNYNKCRKKGTFPKGNFPNKIYSPSNDDLKRTCEKIKINSNFNINVPNFQDRVIEFINKITNSIKCTEEQKKIIILKSKKILKLHIKNGLKDEITIPKNANLNVITTAIIYTVITSNENMPNVMLKDLADIINLDPAYISRYYKIHFNKLYKKKK